MENEIVRKVTSLTLMSIMVAGGLTFAVPGVVPAAYADTPNLSVSAENDMFENYFAGAQVVEVVINDAQFRDSENDFTPSVSVDDNDLVMTQASDGSWYGYFADYAMATYADSTSESCGVGLDFGDSYDAESMVFMHDECMNVLKESDLPNDDVFIQLFEFVMGSDIDVEYDNGQDDQVITLTFDTVEDYAGLALDRDVYPAGAQVHITITDTWLDIDPTADDSWTFSTDGGTLYYGLPLSEDSNIGELASHAGSGLEGDDLSELMCDDNCVLLLDTNSQGKSDVVTLQNNIDTAQVSFINDGQNPRDWSIGFDDEIDAVTLVPLNSVPITVIESDAGVFTTTDDDDNSSVIIANAAERGTSATIDYNDSETTILVGYDVAEIDIGLEDDKWNSGESVTVTITDHDANRNSMSDETLGISDPNTVVPALSTGTPFTITDDTTYSFHSVDLGDVDIDSWPGDFPKVQTILQDNLDVTDLSLSEVGVSEGPFDQFSAIGVIDTADNVVLADELIINYGQTLDDLRGVVKSGDFKGYSYFNYDFRSLAESSTAKVVQYDGTEHDRSLDRLLGDVSVALEAGSCDPITLVDGGLQGYELLQGSLVDELHACANGDENVVLRVSLDLGSEGTYAVYAPDTSLPVVADFMSFGYVDDGIQGSERVANQIIRIEAEETDDNTGVFEGSLDYVMVNHLNILDESTYGGIDVTGDAPTFIVIEDLSDEDSPRVSYNDRGIDGVVTPISAQEEAPAHSGVVTLDSNRYKIADTVTVTLEDADMNVNSDVVDIYTMETNLGSPIFGTVGDTVNLVDVFGTDLDSDIPSSFDDVSWIACETHDMNDRDPDNDVLDCATKLMSITFDDIDWITREGSCNAELEDDGIDTGLDDTGFTLIETGAATGVFTGTFQIPSMWCSSSDSNEPQTTTGLDIEVNYLDFRDASGEIIEVGHSAAVGASTGSVSLDRTVYPVPFGERKDFRADNDDQPDGNSFFPVHSTGVGGDSNSPSHLTGGDLVIHVRVTDPDFDTSASGQDSIATAIEDTKHTGPVKISVMRGSDTVTLGYAGGPIETDGDIYNGIPTLTEYEDEVATGPSDFIRQFGPIRETAPDSGVFEADIVIRYTDGPADNGCPITEEYTALSGTPIPNRDGSAGEDPNVDSADRFNNIDPSHPHFCIMQGDILQVEYTDPIDASGDSNTVTDSATFDLRNGVLQADKSEYVIGTDMILTLIEPDFDLDNDQAETYDLDLIEWDSDAATVTMGDRGGNLAEFDPEPTAFRETGDSTGIFQAIIEIPAELDDSALSRGEAITLEYTDWGPAGADYVGQEDEDVTLEIMTSDFGASIELDQKVYTWTDKVYITVVAPDHNFDSDLVDEIGDSEVDPLKISTRGHDLDRYKLVETGTDTGIFTGEVILSGFRPHDADGDGDPADARGITGDGTSGSRTTDIGPTNGYLEASNDDGLSVSFEYSEDTTLVTSALIRWNIGEVQWLESSYSAVDTGVVRVIDPDMNMNPEAVDNFDINVWSDTDAGGIDLTVTETNEATGIFEGTVTFNAESESSGHRLRVAEGDTVTAEYEDRTLPDPYNMRDDLDITATTLVGTSVPPLERAPASNLRVVDSFGNSLDTVSVDQQVQITADLMNGQDRDQAFAYLVQVQDANGVVISLAWITGSMSAEQSFSPAESWTPSTPGMYTATAFVWESLDNPTALSPPVTLDITVQ